MIQQHEADDSFPPAITAMRPRIPWDRRIEFASARAPIDRAADFMRAHGRTARFAAELFGLEPERLVAHFNARFGERRRLVG